MSAPVFEWQLEQRRLAVGDPFRRELRSERIAVGGIDDEILVREVALDMLGPEAEVVGGGIEAYERWVDGFMFSLAGPIYAGTNEIQRNIIADRVLNLPRG